MRAPLLLMLMMATGTALAQSPPPPPATTAPSMLKPVPTPEADRSLPRQRLVTVFGTEQCPKPTSPDEVVVCARLPESEIYRIPAQLRRTETRQSVFSRNRALLLGDSAGGAGGSIGSCSAVGPGGMIGCNNRQVDAWAADRTERMGYNEETPR
ncbi:MAG: hypothetical protein CFE37_00930 [Alphaproteobacteria bacterium PA4]|nr:MAG: hypothetical protein CFE37_00930 [Alphaproteobacteria bacterium PA4]